MSILRINKYGDNVLRRKAKNVDDITPDVQKLIRDMFNTMYTQFGVGLAAPQVGVSLRILVADVQKDGKKSPVVLINPRIAVRSGRVGGEEGCLSFPGIVASIRRAEKIKVNGINEKGLPVTLECDGLLARCIQHEIDHLDGKLIIDRVPLRSRMKMWLDIRRKKRLGAW